MISIDWGSSIINVPKADTTLIQATPTEVRELNIDTFRLKLKDLEDDEDGMSFPMTHNHYAAVTVGGVQLARVIEILEPYTVSFEDGQYAVNLVGANSNIGDRVNVNNVSIRSANSAGLIQTSSGGQTIIDVSAIADAVWGGALVDHTTADTFGRLISDNLDTPVSTRAIGTGTGPFQSTIQIYTAGTSTPIPDVTIQIYNTNQSVLIASGVTNVAGQRFFALHGGSYKVRLYKSGVGFTVPETIAVGSADSAHTLYGTALTINIPAAIDTCRVYEWCYRPNDSLPYPKINASARIVQLPYNYNGKLHGGDPIPTTYESATGMVYWDIVWGAKVEFAIRELDLLEVKYIPQVTAKRLYEIPSTTIPAATRPGTPDSKVDKYLK